MVKENSQLFILVFLGMLTAFGPFVTDMYLPNPKRLRDWLSVPKATDTSHCTSP